MQQLFGKSYFSYFYNVTMTRACIVLIFCSISMGLVADESLYQYSLDIKKNNDRIVAKEVKPFSCMTDGFTVMDHTAWKELQFEWLGTKFPTITSFGSYMLKRSLYPTDDYNVIATRQALIKKLVTDQELYEKIGNALRIIQESESAIVGFTSIKNEMTGESESYPVIGGMLAYADEKQDQDSRMLFLKVKSLYYSQFFTKGLNKSALALEASAGIELGRMGFQFLSILGADGALNGAYRWFLSDRDRGSDFFRRVQEGFVDGLKRPLRGIDPRRSNVTTNSANPDPDVLGNGTMGDMYWKIQNKFTPGGYAKTAAVNAFAGAIAGGRSAGSIYFMWHAGKYLSSYWLYLYQALNQLHGHMIHLSRGMEAIGQLQNLIQRDQYLQKSCIAQHLQEIFDNASPSLLEAIEELKRGTFSSSSQLYSRGRLLKVHRLLKRAAPELMLLLQTIGELDTVYAFATSMKKNQGTATPFCFVEFDHTSPRPVISFRDCWIPVLDNAVSNSIEFGNGHPTKIIITGPNGGGKSTFLKALGQCVGLAQSWGIVPASYARMTMFGRVLTCLHPQESLQDGMSTFMAEKSRVDEIVANVGQYRSSSAKIMLLLDEPFKGTVDDESAERIYDFGMHIADNTKALVGIATHVYKPIKLAQDSKNEFSNKHVIITELATGEFKREFKLADGPANWWFDNRAQRSRFVDWLGHETMKVKRAAAAA